MKDGSSLARHMIKHIFLNSITVCWNQRKQDKKRISTNQCGFVKLQELFFSEHFEIVPSLSSSSWEIVRTFSVGHLTPYKFPLRDASDYTQFFYVTLYTFLLWDTVHNSSMGCTHSVGHCTQFLYGKLYTFLPWDTVHILSVGHCSLHIPYVI